MSKLYDILKEFGGYLNMGGDNPIGNDEEILDKEKQQIKELMLVLLDEQGQQCGKLIRVRQKVEEL